MPPRSPDPAAARADDIAACRALLRGGSRTFFAASLLLPRRVREPASALYAFCRLADDAVDVDGGREDAVARLRDRLARAYEGRPLPVPADRALAEVVARFAVPRALPEALIEGFDWDAQGRRYETLADLQAYAARVAGSVGAMMAVLMGARAPDAVARACDLGVAMQLTNIARDVGEDARAGRLYLPLAWLREAGIDAGHWLGNPVHSDALAAVVRRLLDAAETLYARTGAGIAQLPPSCRPGIHAARLLYAEIGHEVARRRCDSVANRAVVPAGRKAWLIARALAASAAAQRSPAQPPLAATAFLVESVAATPAPVHAAAAGAARAPRATEGFGDRLVWLLELFERLERSERARGQGAGP